MTTTIRFLTLALVIVGEVVAILVLLRSRRATPVVVMIFSGGALVTIAVTAWILFSLME